MLSSRVLTPASFAPRVRQRRAAASSSLRVQAALPTVFIDGEAGTTGLQVRDRLAKRTDLKVVSIPDNLRKDPAARKEYLNTSSAVILCLPDEAAVEAVNLLEPGSKTVVVDASTAFRTADGWVYGFPELEPGHAAKVAASKRIANPGCYPTGFIGLTRPLVDAKLLPAGAGLVCHAISGYSGGGKALIKVFEEDAHEPWGAYGFNMGHKHLPEMAKSGLGRKPVFCPSVGDFAQGMVVSVPIHYDQLAPGATAAKMHEALVEHYKGSKFVSVKPLNDTSALERGGFLRPDTLNNTNKLELFVFGSDTQGQVWLAARLDNLGKGASGAAVQNMNLALGLGEESGL